MSVIITSTACVVSREEKLYIWKTFEKLLSRLGNTYENEREHTSYPNLYISHNVLRQTGHFPDTLGGKAYFKWISVAEFKKILTNLLAEKVKVKM